MKKLLFFAGMMLFPCLSFAQIFGDDSFSKEQPPVSEFAQMMQQLSNPALNEDQYLKALLAYPPEYHQYLIPAIHAYPYVSQKGRTMPGIAEWKGKLPTRIAPEMQEFAKTNLEWLSPNLYFVLMPEAWPSYYVQREAEQKQPPSVPRVYRLDSEADMQQISFVPTYETLADMGISPRHPQPKATGGLTDGDVTMALSFIHDIQKLGTGERGKERLIQMASLFDPVKLYDAIENPCFSMVNRLYQIDEGVYLQDRARLLNTTVTDFTNKCDRVVKAYRVYNTSPTRMNEIVRMSKEFPSIPKTNLNKRQIYRTTIGMYVSTAADVNAIEPFADELAKTFGNGIMQMATPFALDF